MFLSKFFGRILQKNHSAQKLQCHESQTLILRKKSALEMCFSHLLQRKLAIYILIF